MKTPIFLIISILLSIGCQKEKKAAGEISTPKETAKLIVTLPEAGKISNDKPVGEKWVNLLNSLDDWNFEKEYWKLTDGILHGEYKGGEKHHHAWTISKYKDFELNVLIRMQGKDANSGVCIRLNPTDPDNAPGYQVDMGPGYWGCLWEERRAEMVQKFPEEQADKLVKDQDWNHYYIVAKGHHIQAWLNGVKTIDVLHKEGFEEGSIGFSCVTETDTLFWM